MHKIVDQFVTWFLTADWAEEDRAVIRAQAQERADRENSSCA